MKLRLVVAPGTVVLLSSVGPLRLTPSQLTAEEADT